MTRERINELWPVLEHWKNGGEVQHCWNGDGEWMDNHETSPAFHKEAHSLSWRIKPAPRIVPLDAGDWLKGGPWWIRPVSHLNDSAAYLVHEVAGEAVSCTAGPRRYDQMMETWERRSGADPEGRWLSCSKESKE